MSIIFSKNMKRIRSHHELTQEQAAKIIGIHRSSLGAYEEGRAEPSFEILLKICTAYGIQDIRDFLADEEFLARMGSSRKILPLSTLEYHYKKLKGKPKEAVNILLGLTSS